MNKLENVTKYSVNYRKKPSLPATWLVGTNRVQCGPNTLDYGCGLGVDADAFKWDKYDPCYFPQPVTKKYPFIVCVYVLNVLPEKEREKAIKKIKSLLMDNGVAYVAVRRDVENRKIAIRKTPNRFGYRQHYVYLDAPIVKKNFIFCIYEIRKVMKKGSGNARA